VLVGNIAPVAAYAFSPEPLSEGTTVFVSVLIPHDTDVDSAVLAASIAISVVSPALRPPLATITLPSTGVGKGVPLVDATVTLSIRLAAGHDGDVSTEWSVG